MEDQDDVRRVLPDIRRTAADLGFALRNRVKVSLVHPSELGELGPTGARAYGLTELIVVDDRTAQATAVRVMRGLPADLFHRTVAHELGHAWLGETGRRAADAAVEEGLCELISYACLKKLGTPFARSLRDAIVNNPDPVYGDGFRRVHAAVRAHGLARVLTAVSTTGDLPGAGFP
ncbi:protein DA1 [Actinokineospora soli]|uniref:Protein DA1 n=1 Tax=Actinokineospora soli TaxID=1048753 RepID=A0ABW2TIM7_9PSEU